MTVSPPREFHVPGPRIRVLFAQLRDVGHWRFDNLQAPYWRLYAVREEGAWVRDRAGRMALRPDQVLVIPAHTAFSTGSERPVEQFFAHFVLEPAGSGPPEGGRPCAVPLDDTLQHLLIRTLTAGDAQTQSLTLSALIYATLARSGLPLIRRDLSTRMEWAQRKMRQSLREGITNADLAGGLHMSTNGFVRWFTHEAGISPQAWLNRERVHEASFWLHHTDTPIEEIAELHGFCDRYHFSRVFKKNQGISPAAFRRNREPEAANLTVKA